MDAMPDRLEASKQWSSSPRGGNADGRKEQCTGCWAKSCSPRYIATIQHCVAKSFSDRLINHALADMTFISVGMLIADQTRLQNLALCVCVCLTGCLCMCVCVCSQFPIHETCADSRPHKNGHITGRNYKPISTKLRV